MNATAAPALRKRWNDRIATERPADLIAVVAPGFISAAQQGAPTTITRWNSRAQAAANRAKITQLTEGLRAAWRLANAGHEGWRVELTATIEKHGDADPVSAKRLTALIERSPRPAA